MIMRTCCLLPRLVRRVKLITALASVSVVSISPSASPSTPRFLRAPGGKTAESQSAMAVFLSTFLDSFEESVTILASSLANSASASSDGPRFSCADKTTIGSGDGARSSIFGDIRTGRKCNVLDLQERLEHCCFLPHLLPLLAVHFHLHHYLHHYHRQKAL